MATTSGSRTKTILLVDDSDACRITTKWFLMNFGYAVDSVHSAEEALALFDPEIHDLVITDNSILGMTGTERRQLVANRALQIDAWRRAVATPKRIGPDPKVRFSIKWKREEKEQNWIGVAALPVRSMSCQKLLSRPFSDRKSVV